MDLPPELPTLQEVIVHVASYHTDRSVVRNEQNYGLGLRFKKPQDSYFYMAGFYKNSLYRESVYAGVGKEVWSAGPLSVRVLAGAITGYKISVAPIVLPELALKWGQVGVVVNYAPRVGSSPEVFGFSIVKSF